MSNEKGMWGEFPRIAQISDMIIYKQCILFRKFLIYSNAINLQSGEMSKSNGFRQDLHKNNFFMICILTK